MRKKLEDNQFHVDFFDNHYDNYDSSNIIEAIKANDIAGVRRLTALNPNKCFTATCAKTKEWYIPLHIAAFEGSNEVVKELLSHKDINVNATSTSGYTALYIAIHQGRNEVVKELLSHEDINVDPAVGWSVNSLRLAINRCQKEIVMLLIEKSSKVLVEHISEALNMKIYDSDIINALLAKVDSKQLNNNSSVLEEVVSNACDAAMELEILDIEHVAFKLFSSKREDISKVANITTSMTTMERIMALEGIIPCDEEKSLRKELGINEEDLSDKEKEWIQKNVLHNEQLIQSKKLFWERKLLDSKSFVKLLLLKDVNPSLLQDLGYKKISAIGLTNESSAPFEAPLKDMYTSLKNKFKKDASECYCCDKYDQYEMMFYCDKMIHAANAENYVVDVVGCDNLICHDQSFAL